MDEVTIEFPPRSGWKRRAAGVATARGVEGSDAIFR